MDHFAEYLVQKRPTSQDRLKQGSIVAAAVVLSVLIGAISVLTGWLFLLVLVIGAIYGAYYLLTGCYTEYEYTVTNVPSGCSEAAVPAGLMGKWLLLLWLGLASLLLFGMMGADKKKAKRGQWRISEKTLFLVAICGGAVGGTLGMYQFHHKTKHRSFQIGFPFLAVLQLLLLGYLWMN